MVYGFGCTTACLVSKRGGRRRSAGRESVECLREARLTIKALARGFEEAKTYAYV